MPSDRSPLSEAGGLAALDEPVHERRRLISFFAFAMGLSWIVWAPMVARRGGHALWGPEWLHLVGSLGPALAALIVAAGGSTQRARALLSTLSPWRMGPLAWLVGVVAPVGLLAVGLAVQDLATGVAPAWSDILRSEAFPELSPMGLVAAEIVFFGIGEELGWRGYAFAAMTRHRPALWASLVLTAPWATWHLPLVFSNPTYRELGVAGLLGWAFSLLAGSVLMGWIHVRTRGAVLAVALFHGLLDLVMVNPAMGPVGINVVGAAVTIAGLAAAADLRRPGPRDPGTRSDR